MLLVPKRVHLSEFQTKNESSLEAEARTPGKVDRKFQAGAEPPNVFL
jgi:hypothetical protein